ncbi:MAG: flavohemoprotein [Myxococcales bacterium]|nr:flavohemoprotein [Myxococcales bacterium]
MPLDANVLRSSFDTIIERQPMITPRFYEILFERYPQARPLFGGNSSKKQQEMLQQALVSVLEHLEDASWLSSTLGALGAKHVDYGVTREMYDWVGDSLLATLAETLGDDWTANVKDQWSTAYGVIRDLMLAGVPQATATATATA